MLGSRMTEAVSPAALDPLPDVYTAMGACSPGEAHTQLTSAGRSTVDCKST